MARFRYMYYNRRPDGDEREDCVCRAISTATGLKYKAVEKLLKLTSCNYSCDMLNINCYHNLLDNTLCYKHIKCHNGETVGEIAEQHKDKRLIIRINGHLTSSLYGTIVDIWDCTEKQADVYWIID